MSETVHLNTFIPRTRRAFAAGITLALGVLALTVFSGLMLVRTLVREQILRRDAEALYATTLMEQLDLAELGENLDLLSDAQIGFDSAVRASRLRGVLGIRFFDPDGSFRDTFPATILPRPLHPDAQASVQQLQPHGRFHPDTPLDSVFIYLPSFSSGQVARVPTLEITIPLHQRNAEKPAGAALFIIEGNSVAEEYARLDLRLLQIACLTFVIAGTILAAMLWPAFRRMERLNRDLAEYSRRLQRANEELTLTARISAVGAVSAHLMHGLKNPLASLSQFVALGDPGETDRQDWQDALTAARRMQTMVEHTLEVLSDARGEATYELTVAELGNEVQQRVNAAAERRNITLSFQAEGNCRLSSRTANLASLILVNLLENGIEATPQGGTVSLSVSRRADRLCFRVRDGGPGFPDAQREQLFLPGRSTREGGSGIGLAISKQIADYLGAELELEHSSSSGCIFRLELAMSVCLDPPT